MPRFMVTIGLVVSVLVHVWLLCIPAVPLAAAPAAAALPDPPTVVPVMAMDTKRSIETPTPEAKPDIPDPMPTPEPKPVAAPERKPEPEPRLAEPVAAKPPDDP